MYPIKVARWDKDTGKIHHEIDGQPDKVYLDIFTGLSWPNKSAPPYCCMVGQRDQQNEYRRNPLILLAEYQSPDLYELLERLTDDMKMFGAEGVCTDLTGERECYRDIFGDYCEETNTQGLYLIQAPWPENFSYGLVLIKDWLRRRALEIKRGTILVEQLGKIPENLSEHTIEPEVDFFAVNALRYVLGTFQKHPWQSPNLPPLETIFKGQDRELYDRWAWGIR